MYIFAILSEGYIYTTWKVDGATPMYWFSKASY